MKERKLIGAFFVENGLITEKTLQRMLVRSKRLKQKLGLVLEDIEVITGEELARALAWQYGFQVVSDIARHKFPPELLQIMPADLAQSLGRGHEIYHAHLLRASFT